MEKNENKKTIEVAIFTGGLFGRGLSFFLKKNVVINLPINAIYYLMKSSSYYHLRFISATEKYKYTL